MSNQTTPKSIESCPFKVGELVPTDSETEARVVYIGDADSSWPVLAIHPSKSSDGGEMSAWHTLSGKGRYGAPNLIPPAPPTVRVPLGPEDVPPGSVVRTPGDRLNEWSSIDKLLIFGIHFGVRYYDWEQAMMGALEIKRPGEDWQPMWKEIPAEGGSES